MQFARYGCCRFMYFLFPFFRFCLFLMRDIGSECKFLTASKISGKLEVSINL